MSLKDIVDAIAETMRLAQRVESLSDKIGELSRMQREDAKELRNEVHGLDKRLVKLETLVEYSQRNADTKPRIESK